MIIIQNLTNMKYDSTKPEENGLVTNTVVDGSDKRSDTEQLTNGSFALHF